MTKSMTLHPNSSFSKGFYQKKKKIFAIPAHLPSEVDACAWSVFISENVRSQKWLSFEAHINMNMPNRNNIEIDDEMPNRPERKTLLVRETERTRHALNNSDIMVDGWWLFNFTFYGLYGHSVSISHWLMVFH